MQQVRAQGDALAVRAAAAFGGLMQSQVLEREQDAAFVRQDLHAHARAAKMLLRLHRPMLQQLAQSAPRVLDGAGGSDIAPRRQVVNRKGAGRLEHQGKPQLRHHRVGVRQRRGDALTRDGDPELTCQRSRAVLVGRDVEGLLAQDVEVPPCLEVGSMKLEWQ